MRRAHINHPGQRRVCYEYEERGYRLRCHREGRGLWGVGVTYPNGAPDVKQLRCTYRDLSAACAKLVRELRGARGSAP